MSLKFNPYPVLQETPAQRESIDLQKQNALTGNIQNVLSMMMQMRQNNFQNNLSQQKADREKQLFDRQMRDDEDLRNAFEQITNSQSSLGITSKSPTWGGNIGPSMTDNGSMMGASPGTMPMMPQPSQPMDLADFHKSLMNRPDQLFGAKNPTEYKLFKQSFEDKQKADLNQSEINLREAQSGYYQRKANEDPALKQKSFYFVDPSSHQLFDQNMQQIDAAPMNAQPRTLSNPYAGSEFARRDALSTGALRSIQTAQGLITPEILNELKAIKMTPGKIYSQLASSSAKELYRNLSNAISNSLYLKTGATANPSEIEGMMVSYMPAINDSPEDMLSRLNMLQQEVSLFQSPKANPGNRGMSQPQVEQATSRIRVKNRSTGQTGTISEKYFDPSKYERIQ